MTHHIDALTGFGTAMVSTAALWLAQTVPANIAPGLETGGTVGLIGGLSVALIAVWRDRSAQAAERKIERESLLDELRAEREARLADQKAVNAQYRLDSETGERSRQELIREMKTQTRAIQEKSP